MVQKIVAIVTLVFAAWAGMTWLSGAGAAADPLQDNAIPGRDGWVADLALQDAATDKSCPPKANADGTPAEYEYCWKNFCSIQVGKKCVLVAGTRCDLGNCIYQLVDDPNCIPGVGPSCAVGCQ